ncbi:MAG: Flp pilus assembly protein CpaB [Afipia sp.]|nr:Flp pilus assembly protein CpaB [Afipia sp.]OJW63377.1 MAG: Flp pilus assembly protein CpaB [Afipia sp. 64-13]
MNRARIAVLAIALVAGVFAAYLASGSNPPPVQTAAPVPQIETTDVLIAKSDIGLGQTVTADDLKWQTWPAGATSANFIKRSDRADAIKDMTGTIARSPLMAGEPVRETKLVKGDGSGFMAAILPSGMRAISTEISPETGAGGFILPNDRVDVLLSRRQKAIDANGNVSSREIISSDIILHDVRVLAIDQTIEEKNGQKVVVGKTATLELRPRQAETLARARQSGTLSLALRSLVDAHRQTKAEANDGDGQSITIYRGSDRNVYNCSPECKKQSSDGG